MSSRRHGDVDWRRPSFLVGLAEADVVFPVLMLSRVVMSICEGTEIGQVEDRSIGCLSS
jgi:hypothetical protein